MTFEEIEAFIRARSKYPLLKHSERDGVDILIIGDQDPNGQWSTCSIIVSGLQGTDDQQKSTLADRIDAAEDSLQRYLASFEPPAAPKWDEMQWGP